jgi:hypothetical protein
LRSGRRGSRTLKACARPGSGRMPSPIGLPFRFQSPRQDLNLRSPAPEAGALTRLRYSKILFSLHRSSFILSISPRGRTRTCDLLLPKQARWPVYATRRVGPEGLEPSLRWLRARDAATNTLVPGFSKPTDRSPWAWGLGPEGVEPSPYRLKGGYAAITPQPQTGRT